ncbi:MAG: protoheme IX farnesyltransferase [Gammaproteobacteria bacterium]|nr:protoheme IX farnesyltransferase [Gammaproteobacteria bacterium]
MQIQSTYQYLVTTQRRASSIAHTVKALYAIAKPGIVGLTLVAALAGAYVGNRGALPGVESLVWMLITLALVTAGSCMLNNLYDRDIDRLMARTRSRGLVVGAVSPQLTLIIGLILVTLPLPVMAAKVNVVTAWLTAAAAFGYVVVYTIWAKRRTPWANQLGGIAGALPPMIGVTAAAGGVDLNAWILFVIMVVWQQPHALSLALKYRADYARAGVPVIPVAKGVAATKLRIFIYTMILLPLSMVPYFTGIAGMFYLATATILSSIFLYKAAVFLRSEADCDMRLFLFSLLHLVVLFAALVLDINPVVVP